MGRPKQLLPLAGRPLLQYTVDLAAFELPETVLVLGASADEIRSALFLPPNVRVVLNPHAADGQATSLRAGLAAMSDQTTGALVLLGDQPGVRPSAVRAVATADGPIARASYGGRPGHPVRLDREVWPEVMALGGDSGARELIRAAPDLLVEVEVGGDPPPDVDTPEDYARLSAG